MRRTGLERRLIREAGLRHFGVAPRLFGSRLDDARGGGKQCRCEASDDSLPLAMTPLAEALARCSRHADVLRGAMDDLPLIDVLNRLERFGDLSTADRLRWRALRNSLTHEYPDKPQIRAAVLNDASVAAVAMTGLLKGICERAARR